MKTLEESQEIDYEFLANHLAEIWRTRGNLEGVTLPDQTSRIRIMGNILDRENRIDAFLRAIARLPHERTATQTPQQAYGGSPDSR